MKITRFLFFLVIMICVLLFIRACTTNPEIVSTRVYFDRGWLFERYGPLADGSTREEPTGLESADLDDAAWRKLDLPHDWGIEGPFRSDLPSETGKLPWTGIGWYRKHFLVPKESEGKRIFVDFDGAMSHAMVWLNGKYVGEWPYGYASFRLELTPAVRFGGENVLAVRLDNPPKSSRWYPGAGIYRNAWLVETSPVHVAHWGTFVTTPLIEEDRAIVHVRSEIENQSGDSADISVVFRVTRAGEESEVATAPGVQLQVAPGGTTTGGADLQVQNPKLWSLESRNLYRLVTEVMQKGKTIDRQETVFGIRSAVFTPDNGFLLNGTRVRINGVCDHHDLGLLGTAVNTRALERQIQLLQEMGCNAIRTSHNPPAPELLDLCDRMGMLVLDEAFDCWVKGKNPNDYHTLYKEWHERDLKALVRRDRNHPCVIAWSSGNEVWEQENGIISGELRGIIRSEDTTRPVTVACNGADAGFNGFQKSVDVFGYNYKPHLYGKFHQANPLEPLWGTETGSCISSYGEYLFPVSNDKLKGWRNGQVSSYDLYAPPWATIPDIEFEAQDRNPFVAGEFVWTGFDYLGEPTPFGEDTSSSRSSYFGIMDLCGFKKDRFFLYQSRWRPDLPMAHILPHWNWPDRIGQVTPVHVYTSGDEAELFLNGKSLGRKKKEAYQYRLRWDDVVYAPGELKVVAYKDGKEWAENVVKTTGPATGIEVLPDRSAMTADGSDLSFVTVKLVDQAGLKVPGAVNEVTFTVDGPGLIAAVGNGDPTDHGSFQADHCKAFHGLCMLIVRSVEGRTGTISITARAEGLAIGTASVEAQ